MPILMKFCIAYIPFGLCRGVGQDMSERSIDKPTKGQLQSCSDENVIILKFK